MIERRKYVRLKSLLNIQYRILLEGEKESAENEGLSKNISAGGIQLIVGEWLPPNTVLKLKIHLPDGLPPITAIGEIIWQDELEFPDGTRINTGIRYVKIDDQAIERITKYILNGLKYKDLSKETKGKKKGFFSFFKRKSD